MNLQPNQEIRQLQNCFAGRFGVFFVFYLSCLTVCSVAVAQENKQLENSQFSDSEIEFFENRIRPLLVEHCLSCHGDDEKKLRGGLRLTSREAILAGGDSGPAIVPGEPEESLLISSVKYEDFEMPPKGQLKPEQIADLEKWIKLGVPDPRQSNVVVGSHEIDIEAGKKFWAFAPRQSVAPAGTKDVDWADSKIDKFVLAQLEASGIHPVADASRETLIRRAYIGLIGMPPSVGQIDAFVSDSDSTEVAFATVVDQLLASKYFGQRWGRHWLDVVRFAESSGGGRSLMFPEAWRFRDYVIDSYNADKPFDQFVVEQIAGDLLGYESQNQRNSQVVATGMLALGPTNYEQQDKELLRMEVVDEQVDTIGRAFLGLTLGCARCHDHKFDPIPMTDYYAVAGIFSSTKSLVDGNVSGYVTRPLATEEVVAAERKYRKQVSELSKKLDDVKKRLAKLEPPSKKAGKKTGSRPSLSLKGIVIDDVDAKLVGNWIESSYIPFYIDGHYLHDDNKGKGKKEIEFAPKIDQGGRYEVRMSYTAGGSRASNTPVTIEHQDGQDTIRVNQTVTPPIGELFVSLGMFRFEADNRASVTISNEGTDGHVIVDAVQFLLVDESDDDASKLADAGLSNLESKTKEETSPDDKQAAKQIAEQDLPPQPPTEAARLKRVVKRLNGELKELKKNGPPPVAIAMSVEDVESPVDGHLHIRGSVRNLGPVVKRGFISVCSSQPNPDLASNESGRLQLAQWIADENHPLTARVYVNRVWRHLFGQGLVLTTDNFGFVGQKPSHPELLDHLASEFVANGWSTKKLIRQIMLSHVYRLSSANDPSAREVDDQNRLLWRSNRRRVDAEVLRDSILALSGQLDFAAGGLTINKITQYDLGYEFDTNRRSVYVPVFRNSMLDVFEVFDFANPNLVQGDRNTSTLPTQALFLMNNPMVIEQSQFAAKRLLAVDGLDDKDRIEMVYRQSLGRRPTAEETQSALAHIQAMIKSSENEDPKLAAWSSFWHALYASLDFRYVD